MRTQIIGSSTAIVFFLFFLSVHGFFNFFHQEQRPQEVPYEQQVLNSDCQEYVCPATKQCVKKPVDCDCPFPSSQLKCVLPNKKNYVCISKPAIVDNDKLQAVYDNPEKGPKARNSGVRDCGWVIDAWNGKV